MLLRPRGGLLSNGGLIIPHAGETGIFSNSSRFSPNQLPNLEAWFRFGRGITSATSAVSQWDDASGNGRHLKQATGSAQPTLQGDGSILFDGTSDYLATDAFTAILQPYTIYALAKQVTWTTNTYFWDGVDTSNRAALIRENVTPQVNLTSGASDANLRNGNLAVDTYGVIAAVYNGASSRLQINLTTPTTGNAGAHSITGITLAARFSAANFGHIQYKEYILYAAAHDAATRAQVIAYLAGVGGLSI